MDKMQEVQLMIENAMDLAVCSGKTEPLTLEKAKSLKGEKIITHYFGYEGYTKVDSFWVGEIVNSWDHALQKDPSRSEAYWKNKLTEENIDELKNVLCLLDTDGELRLQAYPKYNNHFDEVTFTSGKADQGITFIKYEKVIEKQIFDSSFVYLKTRDTDRLKLAIDVFSKNLKKAFNVSDLEIKEMGLANLRKENPFGEPGFVTTRFVSNMHSSLIEQAQKRFKLSIDQVREMRGLKRNLDTLSLSMESSKSLGL